MHIPEHSRALSPLTNFLSTTCCIPSCLTQGTMLGYVITRHRVMTCDQPAVIAILYQDSLS